MRLNDTVTADRNKLLLNFRVLNETFSEDNDFHSLLELRNKENSVKCLIKKQSILHWNVIRITQSYMIFTYESYIYVNHEEKAYLVFYGAQLLDPINRNRELSTLFFLPSKLIFERMDLLRWLSYYINISTFFPL